MDNKFTFSTGPGQPALVLGSWQDVVQAAKGGLLSETNWIELKEKLPVNAKDANRKLAEDLASLSQHGGLMIVGVEDRSGHAGEVVGIDDPEGLADRIYQIARSTVKPPLHVESRIFINPSGEPDKGVLVVAVPQSPSTPHMVDGRYRGRGDKGNLVLQDHDVSRLIAQRDRARATFEDDLTALANDDFDPIPATERRLGHFYLLIKPTSPMVGGLLPEGWDTGFRHLGALLGDPPHPNCWPNVDSPTLWTADAQSRAHQNGLRFDSSALESNEDLSLSDREPYALRLLLGQDGSLRMMIGSGTRPQNQRDPNSEKVIAVPEIMELTHSSLLLVAGLAQKTSGYRGSWKIGVRLTETNGLPDRMFFSSWSSRSRKHKFIGSEYREVTESSTTEMLTDTPEVVSRLVLPLARGVGVHEDLFPYDNWESIGHHRQ